MTISYNWLSEYLPESIAPEKLSKILTSIGLEVESVEKYQAVKGGLEGLVIGEVVECGKHPDADKLSITKVNIGQPDLLQIVCGAPNVAQGQKVVVATIGSTIYPSTGDPLIMKKAKIRGVESHGMICAEDEIGLGTSHAGILVLPAEAIIGTTGADYFKPYQDYIFEIGLTPNRMDAMSHLGVAKDVCAYLTHHNKRHTPVKLPFKNGFKSDNQSAKIEVSVEDTVGCERYAGIFISGVVVGESPTWLKNVLSCIGVRPINNIVDITNYILHETGQPLHAFDADKIQGNGIVVKKLPAGTTFITLDEKERKLLANDVMVCNQQAPMCMAGVYGGLHSGVSKLTTNIFLESAWFNPVNIRKTSIAHGLRTDAATRFEKGVDISQTVEVLKRAALLIKELAGGQISSDIIDVYPSPKQKTEVAIKFHYLKKLSGKNYHSDAVKNILSALGFEILKEGMDDIRVAVPFSKPDITLPADIVEEIMRIDGLDNIDIPPMITIAPATETNNKQSAYKEKAIGYLTGLGFNEIFTNSITNGAYYSADELNSTVKMINSLSADLNVLRLSMLQTGLESVGYNINRKNNDLQFFEFGKTYSTTGEGIYQEQQNLALFITGNKSFDGWRSKGQKADIYYAKGVAEKIIALCSMQQINIVEQPQAKLNNGIILTTNEQSIAILGAVDDATLSQFDIKQPVYFINIFWDTLMELASKQTLSFVEIPKFPAVQRDIAIVVDKSLTFEAIEKATKLANIKKMTGLHLFDIFENEKLGADKKSMAINFTFLDTEKTLTDKEIDGMMARIVTAYEKELAAVVRK
jgi:phenylalanyl-tRNA synthetase beta chain